MKAHQGRLVVSCTSCTNLGGKKENRDCWYSALFLPVIPWRQHIFQQLSCYALEMLQVSCLNTNQISSLSLSLSFSLSLSLSLHLHVEFFLCLDLQYWSCLPRISPRCEWDRLLCCKVSHVRSKQWTKQGQRWTIAKWRSENILNIFNMT